LAKREKERRRAWGVCSEAVDGLVSLAMAVVSSRWACEKGRLEGDAWLTSAFCLLPQ
jgi:hypothetical protein